MKDFALEQVTNIGKTFGQMLISKISKQNPIGNRAISNFSGQNPYTRIIFKCYNHCIVSLYKNEMVRLFAAKVIYTGQDLFKA